MSVASSVHPLLHSFGRIYSAEQSALLLNTLLEEVKWQTGFMAFGRRFDIPRQQAWYADRGIHYRYAENQMPREDWNEPLLTIRQRVEAQCGETFNSVLVTLYRDGNDHVGWHADNEKELGPNPVIASLSLGASRNFYYRHKQKKESGQVELSDGELLVMQEGFQQAWEHCVPEQAGIHSPRLNLTFRKVLSPYDMDKARQIMENGYRD